MKNSKFPIGPFGRYVIFSGSAMALMALAVCNFRSLERLVGERALPYVIVAAIGLCVIQTSMVFARCPKFLIIPIGIIGWLTTFALLLFCA